METHNMLDYAYSLNTLPEALKSAIQTKLRLDERNVLEAFFIDRLTFGDMNIKLKGKIREPASTIFWRAKAKLHLFLKSQTS